MNSSSFISNAIMNTYKQIDRIEKNKKEITKPMSNSLISKPVKDKNTEFSDSIRLTLAVRKAFNNE